MLDAIHCRMGRCSEFVLLIIIFILIKSSCQLHELMTDDEIESIFRTNRTNVPEYEVVPVLYSMNEKNLTNPGVYLRTYGEDIKLNLWPGEGMLFGRHTPVYTVKSDASSPHGLHYTKYNEYGLYYAYQDEGNNAAIIIRQDNNHTYKFDGTFGEKLIIRSLPQRIIDDIISKNKSYFQSELYPKSYKNYSQTNHHIIIRKGDSNFKFGNKARNITILAPDSIINDNSDVNKTKTETVDRKIAYPEILVILDYDTFKSLRSDISEALVYLSAFWNGVDLRYRSLSDPKIRLNLAKIVIALDKDATPYLTKHRVEDYAISTGAMKALGEYLYKETRFEKYSFDIAILITRLEVCEWPIMRNNASHCTALRGVSKYGAACAWSDQEMTVEAAALVHDEGFNGIATAAHEIGHILGVPHDGSPSPSYVGGPGATKCNWGDGYLMSSNRFDKNAFKWSKCSIKCFKHFLKQPASQCLYNKPQDNTELPRILPGTLLSLDEQCYEAGALEACYHDQRACVLLYCTRRESLDECFATAPAAEGSACGNGKMCIQGKCIEEQRWKSANLANPFFVNY